MNGLPANQIALAKTLGNTAKGRPKPYSRHLEFAKELMTDLRERGFRLVPFPPLKAQAKKAKRVTRRSN